MFKQVKSVRNVVNCVKFKNHYPIIPNVVSTFATPRRFHMNRSMYGQVSVGVPDKEKIEEMVEKISQESKTRILEQHEHYRGRPPVSLPDWFKEMLKEDATLKRLKEEFDVEFYDQSNMKIVSFPNIKPASTKEEQAHFKEEGIMWHLSHLISESDYVKMTGAKGKEFCLVGESFYFPDFRDFPVKFTPTHRSYLWIDLNSPQPKIMIQINVAVPPVLWIPIKPSLEALGRVFEEFLNAESASAARHLMEFENTLQKIGFDPQQQNDGQMPAEKVRDKMLEYLKNHVDPLSTKFAQLHHHEHENEICLFVGNVADAKDIEITMMNNPFVFNTPILLGSSNRFVANNPVVRSMFRTVFSRSVITIEVRQDLHLELGDGGQGASDAVLPVFARIQYPSNKRMSKPGAERMNRIYNTCYPSDMPVDVIAAFFGNAMKDYNYLLKEMQYIEKNTGEVFVPIQVIAQLAVLRYPEYEEKIFNRYYRHKESMARMACVKGAAELGLKHRLIEMKQGETSGDILASIDRTLEKFESEERKRRHEEEVEKKETADERASIMNKIQEIQYQKKLQQNQQQQQLTNNKNEED